MHFLIHIYLNKILYFFSRYQNAYYIYIHIKSNLNRQHYKNIYIYAYI